MAQRKLNRIQQGTGVYTCQGCHKRTRETNPDAAFVGMCDFCYEQAGWENWVSDNSEFWRNVPEKYRPENWRDLDAAKDARFAELESIERGAKSAEAETSWLADVREQAQSGGYDGEMGTSDVILKLLAIIDQLQARDSSYSDIPGDGYVPVDFTE